MLVVVMVVGVALAAAVALTTYTSVGVSQSAGRAVAHLDLIDRALDRLPLSPVTVEYESRDPTDRREAEKAVKAHRLGAGAAYWFYCGDQCPSWEPGDAVEVFRTDSLGPQALPGNTCDQVGRLLRSAAGLSRVPPGSWVSEPPACSFAGCITGVGIRADFFGTDGVLEDVKLSGIIGTPRTGMVNPPPKCPPPASR